MTREQVHDLIENELRCVQRGNYCDRDCAKCPLVKDDKELIEAYGYVIKALEQEPCEDCISRKAVKELFQEGSVMGMYHFLGIDELPSVTQTRPKEHWIDNNNGTISCSYCYTWFYKDDRYSYMRYCPYCGAEMESEE